MGVVKVCVPRCDTVSRLKLNRTDFENHILRPAPNDQSETEFISYNNKVRCGQSYAATPPRSACVVLLLLPCSTACGNRQRSDEGGTGLQGEKKG